MKKVSITRIDFSSKQAQRRTDFVAQEKPLFIFLNRVHYVTIFCSPNNLKELAVGHVLTEGIVKSVEEIQKISLNEEEGTCRLKLAPSVDIEKRLKLARHISRVIFSACGSTTPFQPPTRLGRIKSDLQVRAELIQDCVNQLNVKAEVFRKTGGVHAAAIYKADGSLIAFAEDVGRHNAVDKVIGTASLDATEFGKCFLASTGRLTGDIIVKVARVGLPIVSSLAAAIDSGIAVAKETGVTLIGFVRGKRMNVYCSPERVCVDF
jgi:FdhD protein